MSEDEEDEDEDVDEDGREDEDERAEEEREDEDERAEEGRRGARVTGSGSPPGQGVLLAAAEWEEGASSRGASGRDPPSSTVALMSSSCSFSSSFI